MNLTAAVVDLVAARGTATYEQIAGELSPHGITPYQVRKALQNARRRGSLECFAGGGLGKGRGKAPGVYQLKDAPPITLTPNSLTRKVAAAVTALGEASVNQIEDKFPTQSRKDLLTALSNAFKAGYVSLVRPNRGGHSPAVWGPGRKTVEPTPRVASVFELGAPRPIDAWPRGWAGSIHRPLGDWAEPWDAEENDTRQAA